MGNVLNMDYWCNLRNVTAGHAFGFLLANLYHRKHSGGIQRDTVRRANRSFLLDGRCPTAQALLAQKSPYNLHNVQVDIQKI